MKFEMREQRDASSTQEELSLESGRLRSCCNHSAGKTGRSLMMSGLGAVSGNNLLADGSRQRSIHSGELMVRLTAYQLHLQAVRIQSAYMEVAASASASMSAAVSAPS